MEEPHSIIRSPIQAIITINANHNALRKKQYAETYLRSNITM